MIFMGQGYHFFQVKKSLSRIGGHFTIKKTSVFIYQFSPFINIIGVHDLAPFNIMFLMFADSELLKCAPVYLAGSHEINRPVRLFWIIYQ